MVSSGDTIKLCSMYSKCNTLHSVTESLRSQHLKLFEGQNQPVFLPFLFVIKLTGVSQDFGEQEVLEKHHEGFSLQRCSGTFFLTCQHFESTAVPYDLRLN